MFGTLRNSQAVSALRLLAALALALTASLLDWWLLGVIGVESFGDVLSNTLIHGVGIYVGFTIAALFNAAGQSGD